MSVKNGKMLHMQGNNIYEFLYEKCKYNSRYLLPEAFKNLEHYYNHTFTIKVYVEYFQLSMMRLVR